MRNWFFAVLIALDQFVNALLGPVLNRLLQPRHHFGYPDETLSSVFGKNINAGTCRLCRFLCNIMHLLDARHCQKSIEYDEGN